MHFSGGTVVEIHLPMQKTGSISGLGRFHMLWALSLCATTPEHVL